MERTGAIKPLLQSNDTSPANGYVNGYSRWLEKEVEYQETDDKNFCEIKVF